MKQTLTTIFTLILGITMAFANTIHVPKDQPTIQAGINAAADGDVVLVAEGTYFENINFLGKKITVASHFDLDQQKIHIKRTIINGSKAANPDFGSVVSFVSGEDTSSVLCGFTITGGTGMLNAMPGLPPMRLGGGVLCFGSGATIKHNIITGNSLSGTPWVMGGGICISPPFIPIYAIVENNVVEKNSIGGLSRVVGGGIDFCASGKVVNNTILHNTALATVEAPAGGGLSLQSWDPAVSPPNRVLVSGNNISHNKALQPDDATFWLGGIGAGIWLIGSEGIIEKNIVTGNEVSGALSTYGSGILLDYPPDDLTFKNNIVSANYFSGSGICYGGGFGIWDGNPLITNNLFIKNKGSVGGGVWLGYNFCFSKLINNTFAENEASVQGGALNTYNSHPVLMNSILWGNTAPTDAELCLESGEIDVSYCDIAGDWPGEGNINMDPKMLGNTYLLHRFSPCVDAGHPDEMYFDTENPWRPGYARIPARGTVHNDMGAFGGPASKDWRELIDDHTWFAWKDGKHHKKHHIGCYPNPFNNATRIQFTLEESALVKMQIYNSIGQLVTTLTDKGYEAGEHAVLWDAGNLASGVYFYKIKIGDIIQTDKLILLK